MSQLTTSFSFSLDSDHHHGVSLTILLIFSHFWLNTLLSDTSSLLVRPRESLTNHKVRSRDLASNQSEIVLGVLENKLNVVLQAAL